MADDKENLISTSSSYQHLHGEQDEEEEDVQVKAEEDDVDSKSPYSTTTATLPEDFEGSSDTLPRITLTFDGLNQYTSNNNNNLRVRRLSSLPRVPIPSWTWSKRFLQVWKFHWKVIMSSLLTIFSATGTIILFPIYLKTMTSVQYKSVIDNNIEEDSQQMQMADAYSSCLSLATISLVLMVLLGIFLKGIHWKSGTCIFRPLISAVSIFKIGFCNGLCILTVFYAWEDHKVLCNLQDPLLGLVFVFAVVTYAVSKYKDVGFRRSFALVTVGAGVFICVDYTIVDRYKCRGYYFYHQFPLKDPWSWQVHLVWTLAFVVAIWLWTVAMFALPAALPNVKDKRRHVGDQQYNAVKMKVIRLNSSNPQSSPEGSSSLPRVDRDGDFNIFGSPTIRDLCSVYSKISYVRIFNATFWFHISTWLVILCLCWTEFIPGFGKGILVGNLPGTLFIGFRNCILCLFSWCLIFCVIVFSQSFAYLTVLIRSPLIAISVTCIAFPLVSIWWSFFQFNHNILVWTPMISGELFCAFLGIPLIFGGIYFLFKFDVLKLDFKQFQRQAQVRQLV